MLHFVKYNLIGILNTLITFLVVGVFHQWLDFPIVPINFLGYVAGAVNSYLLNRMWNFKSRNAYGSEILRFLLVFAVSYGVNLLVLLEATMFFSHDWFTLSLLGQWIKPGFAAHILANLIYVVLSFFLYKKFVFWNK